VEEPGRPASLSRATTASATSPALTGNAQVSRWIEAKAAFGDACLHDSPSLAQPSCAWSSAGTQRLETGQGPMARVREAAVGRSHLDCQMDGAPTRDLPLGDVESLGARPGVDHDSEDRVGPQRGLPPAGVVEQIWAPPHRAGKPPRSARPGCCGARRGRGTSPRANTARRAPRRSIARHRPGRPAPERWPRARASRRPARSDRARGVARRRP
jgi:hypothetical protein